MKQQHFLSEKRKVDLEEEKTLLEERLDNLKALSIQSDQKEKRRDKQQKELPISFLNHVRLKDDDVMEVFHLYLMRKMKISLQRQLKAKVHAMVDDIKLLYLLIIG